MQHRRLTATENHRRLRAILAAGLACGIGAAIPSRPLSAQELRLIAPSPAALIPPQQDASKSMALDVIASKPIEPGTHDPEPYVTEPTLVEPELVLQLPGNSTLELRVARRPWLLEKLINPGGSENEPSAKSRPPASLPDPPSLDRLHQSRDGNIPARDGNTQARGGGTNRPVGDDGWQSRNVAPRRPLATVDTNSSLRLLQPAPHSAAPIPLTDPPVQESPRETLTEMIETEQAQPQTTVRSQNRPDATDDSTDDASDRTGEPESDGVTLRKLRIGPDGRPVSEHATSETARRKPATGHISDLPNSPEQNEPVDDVPDEMRDDLPAETSRSEQTAAPESLEPESLEPDGAREHDNDLDYVGLSRQPLELNRTTLRMQGLMRSCLSYYYGRPEIANERSNWGMLHAIMVYGIDTKVIVDRRTYSTIAWIAGNNACRGQRLLTKRDGRIVVKSGVGLQGHQAQMLAVFSLCHVPEDYPLYADETKFSMRDVIREEQLACKSGEELTFTLIGLSHYLDTDATWVSEDGQRWDFERLIREELSQPIVGVACGGTHRLMGFAHALRNRRMEGKPIVGQWKRAETFTNDFVDYAYRLQNRDGSMSTNWFEGRENEDDIDRKVQTTGHVVEWLLTVTPDHELQNPRLVAAIQFLLTSMYNERGHQWSIGPKGHALRSLAMYYDRTYQTELPWRTPMTARTQIRSQR